MGRRIAAYLIDGLLGLLIFAAIFLPIASGHAKQTDRGTSSAATEECSRFNQTVDSTPGSSSTPAFRFQSTQGLCVPVGTTTYEFTSQDLSTVTGLAYAIGFGSTILNLVILQGLVGASVGKLIVGLRVVRENGKRAGIGWCTLRWILLIVDSICCAIIGLITAFSSKGHRRVGDMAAGTLVVRRSAMGQTVSVPGYNSGYGSANYGGQPGYGGPPGYGAGGQAGYGQNGPTGWSPPPTAAPGAWGSPSAPPAAASAPSGDGPTWDQARNAYIQYDRDRSEWMQWNDATKAWGPISQ
jgi:uncharacterized RDD family membrane protein YckC